jgi:hypothetical protein
VFFFFQKSYSSGTEQHTQKQAYRVKSCAKSKSADERSYIIPGWGESNKFECTSVLK